MSCILSLFCLSRGRPSSPCNSPDCNLRDSAFCMTCPVKDRTRISVGRSSVAKSSLGCREQWAPPFQEEWRRVRFSRIGEPFNFNNRGSHHHALLESFRYRSSHCRFLVSNSAEKSLTLRTDVAHADSCHHHARASATSSRKAQ